MSLKRRMPDGGLVHEFKSSKELEVRVGDHGIGCLRAGMFEQSQFLEKLEYCISIYPKYSKVPKYRSSSSIRAYQCAVLTDIRIRRVIRTVFTGR